MDEATAIDAQTWYLDSDGDGYGDSGTSQVACDQPSGYVDNDEDCDDADSSVQECSCLITSVSAPTNVATRGTSYGQWMVDPLETLGAGLVWEMDNHYGSTLLQFASTSALASGTVSSSRTLPYGYDGTGAVVYDGVLYYNQAATNTVVAYDIATQTVTSSVTLSGAGYRNTYHYGWGGWSDIDLAVDQDGLWAIYATSGNSGRIVVSKLNTGPLSIAGTWNTASDSKTSVGNAFIICGILYTTERYNGNTTLDYMYDTNTSTGASLNISIAGPGGYMAQLDYNPTDGLLYSWDNQQHNTYVVNF